MGISNSLRNLFSRAPSLILALPFQPSGLAMLRPLSSCSVALFGLSLLCLPLAIPPPGHAQSASTGNGNALNLTIGEVGISIGDSRRTTGIRLNYRDRYLERANGLHLTLWRPHEGAGGTVNGLALGLPLTGGNRLRGVAVGAGLSAQRSIDGLAFAPLGLGSGGRIRGIAVGGMGIGAGGRASGLLIGGLGAGAGQSASGILIGGLGAGAGQRSTGLLVGGLGAGAGEQVKGIVVGGLGAGAGGRAQGILIGGAGAGAGESATGILIGGLGAGAGQHATGLVVGGLGVGAGDNLNGIALSAIGVGAGSRLNGIGIGGVGVGAGDHINGLVIAGAGVASRRLTGLSITGGYTRIEEGGLRGVSLAAYNDIRSPQRGLTIGLYNYARKLRGVQLGVINVARNNPKWATVLPGINLHL